MARRWLALIVACALAGCGGSTAPGGSSGNGNTGGGPPVATTLEALLAGPTVCRADERPADFGELLVLRDQDQQILNAALGLGQTPAHDAVLAAAFAAAGVCSQPSLSVARDMYGSGGFGGGAAGHSELVIDGKYLDILRDLANYRALRQAGRTSDAPNDATNAIVRAHAIVSGSNPNGLAYPVAGESNAIQQAARDTFADLSAMILFHEFAHFYAWHSLQTLRAAPGGTSNPLARQQEDEADSIAGMLAAKIGVPESVAADAYVLMHFYIDYFSGALTSIEQTETSAYMDTPRVTHSSISARIQIFLDGHRRMRAVLAPKPALAALR